VPGPPGTGEDKRPGAMHFSGLDLMRRSGYRLPPPARRRKNRARALPPGDIWRVGRRHL